MEERHGADAAHKACSSSAIRQLPPSAPRARFHRTVAPRSLPTASGQSWWVIFMSPIFCAQERFNVPGDWRRH